MKPRLFTKYHDEIKPGLQKDRGYANVHQVPRVEKIVVNIFMFFVSLVAQTMKLHAFGCINIIL